jgi:DNA-binding NarL/FixJ family response regulator
MTYLALRQRPDVLIIDVVDSPLDMLAAIALVRSRQPETRALALTTNPRDDLVFRALGAGVTGVLSKDCGPRELIDGVRAVAAGEAVLSSSVTRRLVGWFSGADVDAAREAHEMVGGLTEREREVLAAVAGGMGNLEIARKLYMSEGAVKAHISRLLTKLRCTNRVQAAMIFHHAGLPH